MGGLGAKILVTRTLPGASVTAECLAKLGYAPLISPVLEIHASSHAKPDWQGLQAVIATSATGVDAIAGVPGAQDVPLFCFSGASFKAAKASAFSGGIREFSGNGEGLSQWICQQLSPKDGPVLWVRGRHFAFDVKAAMKAHGFDIREWEAYEARPVKALKPTIAEAMHKGQVKAVLFHSARGAQTFIGLAEQHGISLGGVKAIAVSDKAAKPLTDAGFADLHIAQVPNEDAMVLMLQKALPVRRN